MNNIQLDRRHFTRRVEISVNELDNAINDALYDVSYKPVVRVLTRYLRGTGVTQDEIQRLSEDTFKWGIRSALTNYTTPIGVISLK